MQEQYFHLSRNRDVGPLTASQIRQMIRSGQIQASDQLRLEGDTYAHGAGEFLAFRDEVEKIVAKETNGRSWVCLRARHAENGSTAAMCGPYARREIVDLVLRGKLTEADFVWREGFTSWKSLGSVAQLRLPIPTYTSPRISWNNQNLDWDTSSRPQMRRPTPSSEDVMPDWLLNGALTVVFGLLAVILWILLAPPISNFVTGHFFHHSTRPAIATSRAPLVPAKTKFAPRKRGA